MSLSALLCHTVTISEPETTTDRYGATVNDWTDTTDTQVAGRMVMRQTGDEEAGRDAQVSTWVLYLAPTASISRRARVIFDESTFDVDGDPQACYDRTALHHYEVPLRRVMG